MATVNMCYSCSCLDYKMDKIYFIYFFLKVISKDNKIKTKIKTHSENYKTNNKK